MCNLENLVFAGLVLSNVSEPGVATLDAAVKDGSDSEDSQKTLVLGQQA